VRLFSNCIVALFFALVLIGRGVASDEPVIGEKGEFVHKATLAEIFGEYAASNFYGSFEPDEKIEFQLFVPQSYDASRPAGIFVFVSPSPIGKIPEGWKSVLDSSNLIWISVNKSGNKKEGLRRVIEAISSPAVLQSSYELDASRFYIAGFSGGGRITSVVSMYYPELFDGSVYMSGVNSWKDEELPGIEQMKRNRFVFQSGTDDFNLRETRRIYREYKNAGFRHLKLMVLVNVGHAVPGATELTEIIEFLDSGVRDMTD
jgi:predicted peptidase